MPQLTDHFSLEELVFSQTALDRGIDNTPSQDIIDALTRTCTIGLEPARALWGVPCHTDSGYRCPELNEAVGGADRPGHESEHEFGRAADLIPAGLALRDAFDTIRLSDIPYDQLIIENNCWIHLGVAADGVTPRHEAMIAVGTKGHWTYQKV
jgi:hypothetical protein